MHRLGQVVSVTILVALAAGCSGASNNAAQTTGAGSTATSSDNFAAEPGSTDSSDLQPTDAPVTFKVMSFKGRGDKLVKFKIPEDAAAIASFTHTGSSNFVVESLDSAGAPNELLVNEIGRYKGTRLFDTSDHSVAFKISADGAWTVAIKPITQAHASNLSATATGTGDDVLRITGSVDGLASSVIKHSGQSNFVVTAYSADGQELLINEIGKYSGEVVIPSGLLLLEIEADGKWSITVPK